MLHEDKTVAICSGYYLFEKKLFVLWHNFLPWIHISHLLLLDKLPLLCNSSKATIYFADINVFWDDFMGDYPFLPHVTQLKAGETFWNMAAPMPSLVLAGSLLGWRWELYFLSGIFTTDCLGPLIARTFPDVPKYMVSLSATCNRPLSVFLNIVSMDCLVS